MFKKKIVIKVDNDNHATMKAKGMTTADVMDALLSALISAIKKGTEDGSIPATLLRDVSINELNKHFPDKEETHE